MALISIITVNFNNAHELKKTIKSVASLNYIDKEYIIIDGGSTDESLTIIKNNSKVIDSFISEKDSGIFDAMNKGIKMSKGEWICFMNSGDTFYDSFVLEKIFSSPVDENKLVLFGDMNCIGKNHRPFIFKGKQKIEKNVSFGILRIAHQASFTKRKAFDQIGYYDLKMTRSADCLWFNKLYSIVETNSFQYIPTTICNFDTTGVSNKLHIKVMKDELFILKNTSKNNIYLNSVLIIIKGLLKQFGIHHIYRQIRS